VKSTHAFVLLSAVDDGRASAVIARDALDDGTLPVVLGCAVALDLLEPVLTLDRFFDDVTGADVAKAARDIAVLLGCDVLALATWRADVLVIVRARENGAVALALWPNARASRPAEQSSAAIVDDNERASALARVLSSSRLLPEEVLPHVKRALQLDVTVPLASFEMRARGEISAHVVEGPHRAHDSGPLSLSSATYADLDALQPFTLSFQLGGATPPVQLALAFSGPLVVDLVRLVGDEAEEVATVAGDGAVFLPGHVLSRVGRARILVEGVTREAGSASLEVSCGDARASTALVVHPPPLPLLGVDSSSTPSRTPFLVARQAGRAIVLATLTADDGGAVVLLHLLTRARGLGLALPDVNDRGRAFDDESATDLIAHVFAGKRVEARFREDARTVHGLVIARPSVRDGRDSDTIVFAALLNDTGDTSRVRPQPLSFDDVLDVAHTGAVLQAVRASWAWDPFCAPFTTPYEAALAVPEGALSTRKDAHTRLRGLGTHVYAAAGPIADALLDVGARPLDDGALLVSPAADLARVERRLAALLRPRAC
jgi:hypothetical protein